LNTLCSIHCNADYNTHSNPNCDMQCDTHCFIAHYGWEVFKTDQFTL